MIDLDLYEAGFNRRYRLKKKTNLRICLLIIFLGVSSLIYMVRTDSEGILMFRWMTVDGTIFTTVMSVFYVAVNLVEILRDTELTSKAAYYARLSSAVTEGLILIIVLLSQLPVFTEHMHILRYDMFNMHILMPILTICSFAANDAPIGKTSALKKFHGTWFVSVYAVVIVLLISTEVIDAAHIPYFFLDVKNMTWYMIIGVLIIIYGIGYLLSVLFSFLNRKLSWIWFKNIACS